jgi:hypothetical protein
MTFSVPDPLAAQFLRSVASRDRSRFVTEALAAVEIEKEFDGIRDEMAQPWK